jgi:ADP-ribosylglycohydrolase
MPLNDLWAFYNASNFDNAVLAAVNLGNDSDTTGAITGQMADIKVFLKYYLTAWQKLI